MAPTIGCTTHPSIRHSACALFVVAVLVPAAAVGGSASQHLRSGKSRGAPIIDMPDHGWGLSRASHSHSGVSDPLENERSKQKHPSDAPLLRAPSSERARLKEVKEADAPHAILRREPQPIVDSFLIVYWGGVAVACVAAWFILKLQHVDAKVLSDAGVYQDSAGSNAWQWHHLQRKTTTPSLSHTEFTVTGAGCRTGAPLNKCNGAFGWAGFHNDKTMYCNDAGAIVFFDGEWKMNHCEDTSSFCFSSGSTSGWEPPFRQWAAAVEGEEAVTVEDGKLGLMHLPENMWSLCLVAALGQAKLPSSNKKATTNLGASVVAAISVFMAVLQGGALFLIIHDIDPNSDPVTTDPASPFGTPLSVNSMKVIMTLLLAIALVSEAGQCKITFQSGLEVYESRLGSSRWLPLAMISLQYLMALAVVWAGCCAILSFQSVPDIIYSSMAITLISNVDEFFYEGFQEVTGLDANFRVTRRDIAGQHVDGEDAPHDHKHSVKALPFVYHFIAKFSLFFPMLFALSLFGRAWYTGHMPSERVATIFSGLLSWFRI